MHLQLQEQFRKFITVWLVKKIQMYSCSSYDDLDKGISQLFHEQPFVADLIKFRNTHTYNHSVMGIYSPRPHTNYHIYIRVNLHYHTYSSNPLTFTIPTNIYLTGTHLMYTFTQSHSTSTTNTFSIHTNSPYLHTISISK